MSEAGTMAAARRSVDPNPSAAAIPQTLHFIWFGGEPDMTYAETWRKHHPEYTFTLWTDDNDWTWLHNYDLFEKASVHAPGNEGQFKSDIARYEILATGGGVYVDMDFECKRSIDDLVATVPDCFAAYEEQGVWVNNAIMGAAPDSDFMKLLVQHLPANVERKAGHRPNKMTGPQYLTRMVAIVPTWIKVFPQGYFYPYSYNELDRGDEDFPEAYAVHHWHNQRRRRGDF